MINILGYRWKLPGPHFYTWINTGVFPSGYPQRGPFVWGKTNKKRESFASAARFEALRGLHCGSDLHLKQ